MSDTENRLTIKVGYHFTAQIETFAKFRAIMAKARGLSQEKMFNEMIEFY